MRRAPSPWQRPSAQQRSRLAVPRQDRRQLLTGGGLLTLGLASAWLGAGAGGGGAFAATGEGDSHAFSITLDARGEGPPVNRQVLGQNLQWVDRGDDLLLPDGRFDPKMLALVQGLGPTSLRFPGGSQSDVYHWERGIGPQAQRGENQHFHSKRMQPSTMGTAEFLQLCARTGARPLITVNVLTGTPEEAARWVRACNVQGFKDPATGQRLPRVPDWEIGNEPYLRDEAQPALALEPEAFARRADAFMRAMRVVDPSIRLGLPVSNNSRQGVPVVHFPDYTRRLLRTLTQRIDFAAVHNAYMPFTQELDALRVGDREKAYWAAMAATRSVQDDLLALRRLLAELRPAQPLPLAITEYNAIFSLGHGAMDEWLGSPAGALYVADALRLFAHQPEVAMAQLWSLSGNWRFGAISQGGFLRPVGQVMGLMNQALQGRLLSATTRVQTVAVPGAGLVAPVAALPLIETLATRSTGPKGEVLRLLLIHKDPARRAVGALHLSHAGLQAARLQLLSANEPLRADDVPGLFTSETRTLPAGQPLSLVLPPACVCLLEIDLPRAGAASV